MEILKFHIFESSQNNLDNCTDIIETFNELQTGCKVSHYKKGFGRKGYDGYYFIDKQESEDDKLALTFTIDVEENTLDVLSDVSKCIEVSKGLLQKFKRYCDSITTSVNHDRVGITLFFDNEDNNSKFTAKVDRIYKDVSRFFESDYNKRINIYKNKKSESDNIETLKELLLSNDKLVDSDKLPWYKSDGIEIRFSHKINIQSDKIIIDIGPIKFKVIYSNDRIKEGKFTDTEVNHIIGIILNRISNSYHIEKDIKDIDPSTSKKSIILKIK